MYDLLTSTVLFIILTPGVVLTLPPSGGLTAAIVHAIVFYVVQAYLSKVVPWWGIWILAVVVIGGMFWYGRSSSYYSGY